MMMVMLCLVLKIMINMKRLLSILNLYLLFFRVYSKNEVNDYIDKIKKRVS